MWEEYSKSDPEETRQVSSGASDNSLAGEVACQRPEVGQGHTPKGLNNRERSLDLVLEAVGTTRSRRAGINCWRKSHSPVPRFYS